MKKMSGARWTEEQYRDYLEACRREQARKKTGSANAGAAVSAADVECNSGIESAPTHVDKKIYSRVCIHVHSKRRRLADPGAIYDKALVDGLRAGGLFADDSLKYVAAITDSQEQASEEQTIVTIVWEQ
jgi:hypothetical protein